jgi:alanine-synthesizing transaminase
MGTPKTSAIIPPASRMSTVSYSIRRVVAEAKKAEAAGKKIHYLNTGDPVHAGFQPPAHMVEAVHQALRNGEHGYGPSIGLPDAREAVAAENTARGWPVSADRVVMTSGSSEAIDFVLTALADPGDEVLVPLPTYPLYTAILHKIGAREVYYPTDPKNGWQPDPREVRRLITSRTKAIVTNDPNNPTGASYAPAIRRELVKIADEHNLPMIADEIYQDVAFDGPISPIGAIDPDAPVISLSGLSKGYLVPGWRTGWLTVGRGDRLKEVLAAITKLAEGRLCSTMPMQRAVVAALKGDRSHQRTFRTALRERADLVHARANAIPGISSTRASAAFYAMPKVELPPGKTDADFIIDLVHATGVLCVHGSGFGMDPADGYFRMVTLAPPDQLNEIWDLIAKFTQQFCART